MNPEPFKADIDHLRRDEAAGRIGSDARGTFFARNAVERHTGPRRSKPWLNWSSRIMPFLTVIVFAVFTGAAYAGRIAPFLDHSSSLGNWSRPACIVALAIWSLICVMQMRDGAKDRS